MGDLSGSTNLFASPSPTVQNTTSMQPPGSRRNRSAVWNDFTLDPNSADIAICNHCRKRLKYNGTSSMAAHSKICKNNPNNDANKRLRTVSSSSPLVPKFDQEKLSTVDQFNGESNPVILPLDENQMILGLKEVLTGMRVGGKRRALIPPSVGYVDENLKPIPEEFGPRRSLLSHAQEPLVFEVQLLKIRSVPQQSEFN